MQQDSPEPVQRRLPLLMGFIILFALVLFFRLWHLQVAKGAYYYELAESNRIRPIKIRPPRGVIFDRKGRPMVENVLTFDISLVPEDAPDLDEVGRAANGAVDGGINVETAALVGAAGANCLVAGNAVFGAPDPKAAIAAIRASAEAARDRAAEE